MVGIFSHRHLTSVERREIGYGEAALIDISNLDHLRSHARPFRAVGNESGRLACTEITHVGFWRYRMHLFACWINDIGKR